MGSTDLEEFVAKVSERTDIYSVVSRYVSLTQKGGRYWGCCPFHSEKTASFCVSVDKGFFYCFGCGAGGNAFKFLSLIENVTYFEAIKLQAQRLGIDLPTKRASPEEERRRREEKNLLKINELAQDFYHECLINTARGEVGRKYLEARGITAETIETFKLGYAPDEWEGLFNELIRQKFTAPQLEAVGLVAKRKTSSGYYDRFRGRVMIPINNIFGQTVGFGGRVINSDNKETPKYLNTPETVLFNKRNLLFGLDKSNRLISTAGAAIVVEGYMDAVSLFSEGIKNVVATLGTAFTTEHAKLILRYAKKIIFCYDSDEAGQRATIRALPIVQAEGAEVFVIKVPDGKDPDEFIRKHGKAAFEELIKGAEPLVDYRIKYVLDHTNHDTISGKIQALNEILPVIAGIKENIIRNEYYKKIAAALILDERVVEEELNKVSSQAKVPEKQFAAIQRKKLPKQKFSKRQCACEVVLRMMWHETDTLSYVLSLLPQDIFSEPQQEIISWLKNCLIQEIRPDQINAARELSDEANAELSRILLAGADEPRDMEMNLFYDSMDILRIAVLKKKYDELLAQAGKYTSSNDENYVELIQNSLKVKQEIVKLSN
ncbi:MAG: DNA primase [Selenomonadaceae bacterium]|nr:DNA primase [Selenomonadaceae bacterium]